MLKKRKKGKKEKRGHVVIPFDSMSFMFLSFLFLFFLQVTMSQDKIVTCFYKYAMKRYEVL